MSDFSIHKNGFAGPLIDSLRLSADGCTTQQVVLVHSDGSLGSGKKVTIVSSAPLCISKIEGKLNADGRFYTSVGPSLGEKGDVTLTITVEGISNPKFLGVRFV